MSKKRHFERLDETWQLTYHVLDDDRFFDDPIQQYTMNISGGGVCFNSHEELKPGTQVALELNSTKFPEPMLALTNVVWCKRKKGRYEVGAEYWWTGWKNNSSQKTIANFIATNVKGDDELAEKSVA